MLITKEEIISACYIIITFIWGYVYFYSVGKLNEELVNSYNNNKLIFLSLSAVYLRAINCYIHECK